MRKWSSLLLAGLFVSGCGSTIPVDVNQAIENKQLPSGVTITLKDGERILAKNATVQGNDIVVREVVDHRKTVAVDPPRVIHRDEIATMSQTKADMDNGIGLGVLIAIVAVFGVVIAWVAAGAPLN